MSCGSCFTPAGLRLLLAALLVTACSLSANESAAGSGDSGVPATRATEVVDVAVVDEGTGLFPEGFPYR